MQIEPIQGKTVRWRFTDGPTKGQDFEHEFGNDGRVTYRMTGSEKSTTADHYVAEPAGKDVVAVSYRGASGWTLTCVLDFATMRVTGFASNADQLVVQHGTFEMVRKRAA